MSEPATAPNPRATIGDNQPPLFERLALDYQDIGEEAEAIAARANALPAKIENAEQLEQAGRVVIDARALRKRADDAREAERAPLLEAGKTIQDFFAAFMDRMKRIQGGLETRANLYQQELADAARRKAEEEAAAIRKADEERAAVARAAIRKAEEEAAARQAAADAELARGRKGSAAKKAAEAEELRRQAEIQADLSRTQSSAAQARAGFAEATAGDQAKEAARIRTDAGLASTTTKWKGAIDVWDEIDLNELKPHFSRGDVEKAINGYVRLHKNDRPLKGVVIQPDTKTTFR